MLSNLWSTLNGKKTYIIMTVTVAYAAVQWWSGAIDQAAAFGMIAGALGLGAVRHGVSTRT